jgi:hypothetical protein
LSIFLDASPIAPHGMSRRSSRRSAVSLARLLARIPFRRIRIDADAAIPGGPH